MTVQYHFTGLLRHALLAAAALTIGAGPALAQGSIRSAVIPGTLPAPARPITDRTTIGQAEAALNAAVTQYRLGGAAASQKRLSGAVRELTKRPSR